MAQCPAYFVLAPMVWSVHSNVCAHPPQAVASISILLLVSSVDLWMIGLLKTCRGRNTSEYGLMGGTERD
ncbi:hypothetical protein [Paenibacillus polymyxa]|uniref:hypothetical protein n=1 Tax=Paenibacillus TaxID=44249 RepID=UPI002023F67D|nr:hypothetical protein [Paenibacillus polymyxa]URJ40489.3 hypothetical protein MF627_005155 [Paenibacillus polymyxa]